MNSELFSFMQGLLQFALLLSAQLLIIMLIRKPVARWFGAANAYRLWLLPLLWLPLFFIDLPGVELTFSQADTAPVNTASSGWLLAPVQNLRLVLDGLPVIFSDVEIQSTDALTIWPWLFLLWGLVSLTLLILQTVCISAFSRRFSDLRLLESRDEGIERIVGTLPVFQLKGLSSPAIFGIVKPRLLLPDDFNTQCNPRQRELILAHEAVHYRRRDNLWNLLATSLRIVFWFNPLVHLAWHSFRLDQELSCDEIALRKTHPHEGKQYARLLLDSMDQAVSIKHQPALTAWGNLREIKERTQMIKHHLKHKPRTGLGLCLLFCCVVVGSAATEILTNSIRSVQAADSTTTLSNSVYKRIEQVMQMRDEGNLDGAREILNELLPTQEKGKLNSREYMVVLQFQADISREQENLLEAIDYLELILAIDNLEAGMKAQTLMMTASMYFALEDYEQSAKLYEQYIQEFGDKSEEAYLRLSYALYSLKRYDEVIPNMEKYFSVTEDPKRNDYSLLFAVYMFVEDYPAAYKVNEQMIELFGEDQQRTLLSEQLKKQLSAEQNSL